MPRTHRSRRGTRVAAVTGAAGVPAKLWPSARRWLVVAGLLSGAWFAGAACASADETGAVLGETAAAVQEGQEQVAETAQKADAPDPATGSQDPGGSEGAGSRPGPAGDAVQDGAASVQEGVGTLAADSLGTPASGAGSSASTDPAGETGRQRPADSGEAPQEAGSAADRLSGAVAAVGKVGRDAGRTVPVSVAASGAPGAADAVSEARAAGLHGIGMGSFDPVGFDGADILPDLGIDRPAGPAAGAERAPGGAGSVSAARGTGAAPAAEGGAHAHPGTPAVVGYAGFAQPDHDGASGGDESEPRDAGTDRPEAAAAVGSAVNTPQPGGGVCAGYLPAAASAAPAAGRLLCARQALADAPQDLGEQPTFSPD
ncbi:hypothetical protein FZ103_09075 [Streptomonospora sp. PA3]|uniref:hypothetical protein n=1 Tax=Streptomonospora sp. PA3 TaxID=2607326 RepID=UPI0012DEA3C2|nr:hypothetical protein [Streptomonospora sp. PA3]MUL41328.1 hypothetical protein [Streptomonospora sp. PA3]